jgi:hypothetical protein
MLFAWYGRALHQTFIAPLNRPCLSKYHGIFLQWKGFKIAGIMHIATSLARVGIPKYDRLSNKLPLFHTRSAVNVKCQIVEFELHYTPSSDEEIVSAARETAIPEPVCTTRWNSTPKASHLTCNYSWKFSDISVSTAVTGRLKARMTGLCAAFQNPFRQPCRLSISGAAKSTSHMAMYVPNMLSDTMPFHTERGVKCVAVSSAAITGIS